jgi:hypothetical protein
VSSYSDDSGNAEDDTNCQLKYDLISGTLSVSFNDNPDPKYWISNGEIVSVPDLLKSVLTLSFLNITVPRNDKAQILSYRAGLILSSITLYCSGRGILFRGEEMKDRVNSKGLHSYTIHVKDGEIFRWI